MNIDAFVFKCLRKIFGREDDWYSEEYVEYRDQTANDYIRNRIRQAESGLMVCKFGTIELEHLCCLMSDRTILSWIRGIRGEYSILPEETMGRLCSNAGFFPNDGKLGAAYKDLVLRDIGEIDILASYQRREKYLGDRLSMCTRVNLEGFYAPFLWGNPWTKELKGRKVLVVHPFTESIQRQYGRRELLFENPDVLPEFGSLTLVKAVQSIAGNGNETGFHDWFEALDSMKQEIDRCDYEIALIGCGAYGMDLAAHVKRRGKIAIHLAGWTQMLFGVYGNRWLEDQPAYKRFINEYWIRPSESEKVRGAERVENGCYW